MATYATCVNSLRYDGMSTYALTFVLLSSMSQCHVCTPTERREFSKQRISVALSSRSTTTR